MRTAHARKQGLRKLLTVNESRFAAALEAIRHRELRVNIATVTEFVSHRSCSCAGVSRCTRCGCYACCNTLNGLGTRTALAN